MCGETFTNPRSTCTPRLSSPSPATLAERPTAMSTCSASSFSPSSSMTTPGPPGFTEATFTPVLRLTPRRVNVRASSFETSSSSTGTMRGSASTSVTWTPYAAYTSANSTPTAPAPMMAIDLGARSFRTAPFDEITVFSSMATPGSDFGSDPVAMMMARASIVSVAVAPFTSTTSKLWVAIALDEEPQRLFEQAFDVLQEPRAHRSVHHPVIARDRQRHPPPDSEPGVIDHRHAPDRPDREDRALGWIDDGRELGDVEHAEVRDREGCPRQLLDPELAIPRALGQVAGLDGDPGEWLSVAVAQHGRDEAVLERDGDADVRPVKDADRVALQGGVHARVRHERERAGPDHQVVHGDLGLALQRVQLLAQLPPAIHRDLARDVEVGHRRLGQGHPPGDRRAHLRKRYVLELGARGGRRRRESGHPGPLDVTTADAPPRSRA